MSTLNSITNEIITIIETTSAVKAIVGWNDDFHSQFYPGVQIAFYDGSANTDINNTIDLKISLNLCCIGSSYDQLCTLLEELLVLFENDTEIAKVRGLGMLDMKLTQFLPPICYKGNNSFIGSLIYECMIRYNY